MPYKIIRCSYPHDLGWLETTSGNMEEDGFDLFDIVVEGAFIMAIFHKPLEVNNANLQSE